MSDLELDLPLDVGQCGIMQGSAGRAWMLMVRHSHKGEKNIFCSPEVALEAVTANLEFVLVGYSP